jgi:small subunit ribosomal protein S6
MRQYETGFLVSPNLTEEETDKLILQMAEVISQKKGKMLKEDRWGKRKLAYPINKFEEAFYVFFHYEGEHDVPSELERRFKQTDTILRYLTIKRELKEDIKERKKPVKAKEKEAEMPEAGDEKEAVEKKVEEDIMEKEDLPSDELKEEEK